LTESNGHLILSIKRIGDSIQRIMPAWTDAHMPLASHVRGMLAFGLEECNELDAAERMAIEVRAAHSFTPTYAA
jgi:hypothetical protein